MAAQTPAVSSSQVERIAERGSLNPRQVQVPGVLVGLRGGGGSSRAPHADLPASSTTRPSPARSACRCRRSADADERAQDHRPPGRDGAAVQRGGEPRHRHAGGVATVAAEEKLIDLLTLTAEPGVIGGIPAGGLSFGAAVNTRPSSTSPASSTSTTAAGWTSPSRPRPGRPRGQPTCRSSARGSRARAASSTSAECQEGRVRRHLQRGQPGGGGGTMDACASSARARRGSSSTRSSIAPSAGRRRQSGGRTCSTSPSAACSGWCEDGLELIEIAPGIDLQRDILACMDFVPVMKGPPVRMDARIFADAPMGFAPRPARTFRSGRRLATRRAAQDVFFVDSRAVGAHAAGHRRDSRRGARRARSTPGARWMRWSTTTASRSCRNWWTTTSRW